MSSVQMTKEEIHNEEIKIAFHKKFQKRLKKAEAIFKTVCENREYTNQKEYDVYLTFTNVQYKYSTKAGYFKAQFEKFAEEGETKCSSFFHESNKTRYIVEPKEEKKRRRLFNKKLKIISEMSGRCGESGEYMPDSIIDDVYRMIMNIKKEDNVDWGAKL